MRIKPQAVIFDYGNVLSQSQPHADVAAMAAILDLPVDRFAEIYWQFRVPYDAAALTPVEYWNSVARTASRTLSARQIDDLVRVDSRSWSHAGPVTPQWARDLRAAGFRTAVLSNMPLPVRDYIFGCGWLPDFDVRTFSCDLQRTKPAPEIYHHCLQRLGVAPCEVLFLDDREANVRAAQALGLGVVLYTGPAAAFEEIARRFDLPAPNLG